MIRILNIRQMENEGLLEYIKRFKESRDIMKTHIRTDILNKFVENTKDYQDETDVDTKKEMKDGAFGKWMAYLLIRSSDQGKYRSLMNGLVSQFSIENNQYPKTIRAATDILSNHKHDRRGNQNKNKKDWVESNKEDDKTISTITTNTSKTSFAQGNAKSFTCFCCRKKGHISPECPEKNSRKKEDWAIKKAELHMQAGQEENKQEDNQSTSSDVASTSSK
jgi:hypothetical protein